MVCLTESNPSTELVTWSVSQWTHHSNLLHILEWEYAIVLEQHHRVSCNLASILHILGTIHHLLLVLTAIFVWIVEQAEAILHSQHLAAELINGLLRHLTLLNEFLAISDVVAINHIHIEVSVHSLTSSILAISRCAVFNLLVYSVIVRNNKTIKAQLLTQEGVHQPLITRCRDAHKVIERRHHSHCTRLNSGLIWREVVVAEHHLRHIYSVVVTTRLRCAISSKVLHASCDGLIRREVITLVAAHDSSSNLCTEVRILTCTLRHTTPTRVCRYVAHRRKCPVDTQRTSLLSCNASSVLDSLEIPATRCSEILRELNTATVDNIKTEDKRNTQTRLLDSYLLQAPHLILAANREERADCTLTNCLLDIAFLAIGTGYIAFATHKLLQLTELLLQGHLLDKLIGKVKSLLLLLRHLWRGRASHHSQSGQSK